MLTAEQEVRLAAAAMDAAAWQQLLDEKFPHGAMIFKVFGNSLLRQPPFFAPYLYVSGMIGQFPIIYTRTDEFPVVLYPTSWQPINRSGYYCARCQQADVPGARDGIYEINSWMSQVAIDMMAAPRAAQMREFPEMAQRQAQLAPSPFSAPTPGAEMVNTGGVQAPAPQEGVVPEAAGNPEGEPAEPSEDEEI